MDSAERRSPDPFDIVVVSPNAALDSYYLLSDLQVGAVNRAHQVYHTAGGKGNNLARAVKALGGQVMSLGIVGGFNGRFIVDELAREGIPSGMVWVDQETRRSSTIIVPGQLQTTVVLDTGNPIGPEDGEQLRKMVGEYISRTPFLVLTGSLPPGLENSFYADIVQDTAPARGVKVYLDCSGAPLQAAAEAGSKIIKVNTTEYLSSFSDQQAEFTLEEVPCTFQKLQASGVELLIVTDGPNGAYVFSDQHRPFCVKTRTESWVSTAGAGDTFTAGLLTSLNRGLSLEQSSAYASAAAVAALQQIVCGCLDPAEIEGNLARTEVHPIWKSA